ncbi:hypothetical protein [Streptomyces gilvosporeus]|uniref:Uncharacterized protein n=1 Tax=Streptomyces gilvosporeus TaxID=553510 RepID=A0A1V0TUH1_9ACTN|nr:hypothetical protein [Streptomyces gilvosporeus]ARF56605.1 hypothetical protein B1H19_22710 [Streptomyces gilvosporeus]
MSHRPEFLPADDRYHGVRRGTAAQRTALIIHTIADIAAAFLGLWILLYLLDANQGNVFVQFVQGMADSLAWWARDIFTMNTEGLRVALNYGLPAVIYLLAGHLIAGRVRRL